MLSVNRWLMQNLYFTVDLVAQFFFGNFEVVTNLQPKPNSRTCAKIPRQTHRSINCNRPLTFDNLADTNWGNANVLRQAILT